MLEPLHRRTSLYPLPQSFPHNSIRVDHLMTSANEYTKADSYTKFTEHLNPAKNNNKKLEKVRKSCKKTPEKNVRRLTCGTVRKFCCTSLIWPLNIAWIKTSGYFKSEGFKYFRNNPLPQLSSPKIPPPPRILHEK